MRWDLAEIFGILPLSVTGRMGAFPYSLPHRTETPSGEWAHNHGVAADDRCSPLCRGFAERCLPALLFSIGAEGEIRSSNGQIEKNR